LYVARRYLEAHGVGVQLLDRALDQKPPAGVLVLAFPWQRLGEMSLSGVTWHLQQGGTVVVAYAGEAFDPGETRALEALGLQTRELRGDPPLHPLRWREYMREEWSLVADPGAERPALNVRATHLAPRPSAAAEILYRNPAGTPMAFVEPRGRGRLIVLPVDALSNARIAEAGNADLLESLAQALPRDWTFDEYHHGLVAAVALDDQSRAGVVDLILLHLCLFYGLAVWAMTRRFGPAWHEAPVASGSAAALLLDLGGLHQRLGHHAEAALRLVERARELDPRCRLPEGLGQKVNDGPGLLRVARAVARAQGWTGRQR
jgi:hypothetical protein